MSGSVSTAIFIIPPLVLLTLSLRLPGSTRFLATAPSQYEAQIRLLQEIGDDADAYPFIRKQFRFAKANTDSPSCEGSPFPKTPGWI